jgi:F420H(2)-dependent quinone reductase
MSTLNNLFTRINVFVYRISNGLIGSKLGRQSVLLLYTVGRKTSKKHITSLSYYRDGNTYLIVASNWGYASNPSWYYNLLHQPKVSIQVGGRILAAAAHPATDAEYQRLWDLVSVQNDQYGRYQKGLPRRIPIIVLTPTE